MKTKHSLIVLAIASLFTVSAFAAPAISGAEKGQIETIVHDYIIKNPEVILESVKSMQEKEFNKMQEKSKQAATKASSSLFNQASDPVAGNANGKITVVEFFDYQCPHCVDMVPTLNALIKANPNVRVVFKEFPIRGSASVLAAKAALAAKNQGKYVQFHDALMKAASSGITEDKILSIATSLGLDANKLKADMVSSEVDQQIKANYQLAQALQLVGTPALFVAKTNFKGSPDIIEFIPGQVDVNYLQKTVEKVGH